MKTEKIRNDLSSIDISDVKTLQGIIVDLIDTEYNEGDNNTGLSDERFMELVDVKNRILALKN